MLKLKYLKSRTCSFDLPLRDAVNWLPLEELHLVLSIHKSQAISIFTIWCQVIAVFNGLILWNSWYRQQSLHLWKIICQLRISFLDIQLQFSEMEAAAGCSNQRLLFSTIKSLTGKCSSLNVNICDTLGHIIKTRDDVLKCLQQDFDAQVTCNRPAVLHHEMNTLIVLPWWLNTQKRTNQSRNCHGYQTSKIGKLLDLKEFFPI